MEQNKNALPGIGALGRPTVDLVHAEINGLVVDREMGILPKEIGKTQRITLNVCVGLEPRMIDIPDTHAGLLEHGFDIGRVRDLMREEASGSVNLLETLANNIANRILSLPGARTVRVEVSKERTWADVKSSSMSVFKSR